jgi:hypothetical protein
VPGNRAASVKRTQHKSKRSKESFNAQREALKLLLFTQVVLYLAGGALPGHLRLLTLLPLVVLAGAGAFRGLALLMTWLHAQRKAKVGKPAEASRPAPAVRAQPTPVAAKVVASRVA